MRSSSRWTLILGLAVVASGLFSTSTPAASLGPECPQMACPLSSWDPECGFNNPAADMCQAAGCTGDMYYSYCSSFVPCPGGRMGAVCVEGEDW
jgi:hypothetical protein